MSIDWETNDPSRQALVEAEDTAYTHSLMMSFAVLLEQKHLHVSLILWSISLDYLYASLWKYGQSYYCIALNFKNVTCVCLEYNCVIVFITLNSIHTACLS